MRCQAFYEAFVFPDFGMGIPSGRQAQRKDQIERYLAEFDGLQLRLKKREGP